MRIVKRDKFVLEPAGTVFSAYAPCHFGPLSIKGESVHHAASGECDFMAISLANAVRQTGTEDFVANCDSMHHEGVNVPVDLADYTRDGLYEHGQYYAIWSWDDVVALVAKLAQALKDGYASS